MKPVKLQRFCPDRTKIYSFQVPASKSIACRALLLAAFSDGDVLIGHGPFCEDNNALLACLEALGIRTEEQEGGLLVHGCGGRDFNRKASLNVMSAGTCARFLPAVLAALGGEYEFDASQQMKKRPMEYLTELERAGAEFEYLDEPLHFPFRMRSKGFSDCNFTVSTDTSTQYASALMLAGALSSSPVGIRLTGSRTNGSYIEMTLALLTAFGAEWKREKDTVTVTRACKPPREFEIEADVSAACYFYALSLLFGIKVLVRHVRRECMQGDVKFLGLLEARGVVFNNTLEGLLADGSQVKSFCGFEEDFCDFSDQTLTAAALAPFASSPSRLTGIGHIRAQECDRVSAIVTNLNAIGVPAKSDGNAIFIEPCVPAGGDITTYQDHRVAMAFALTALGTGTLTIDDKECCKKTFPAFFEEIGKLFI